MLKILTGHQLRVVNAFGKFKEQMLPTDSVRVMYRSEGYSVNIGLAFTEGDQNYIVRQTVLWYASDQTIFATVARMIAELGKTYVRSTAGRDNLFDKV